MGLNRPILLLIFILSSNIIYSQTATAPDTIEVDDGIFQKVEVEASYPGGLQAWRSFLEKNLNANVPVDNSAPAGMYTVIVQFVVSKNGTISDIKALTNNGYGTEAEVIRILKKSGNWSPAIQNGKPVNAYRKQPVTFVVSQDGFDITTKTPYTLFTGIDNEITVDAGKVKSEDLNLTISQGSIVPKGNGVFIVKVKKTGRAIITVFGKKNKEIGEMSFEVRETN